MEPKRIPLNYPPGLYQAGTKLQAEGRWFDGNLTRFFEKTVRSVGGWRRLTDLNGSELEALPGFTRKVLSWAGSGGGSRFFGAGVVGIDGVQKLIIYREGLPFDVTPADLASGIPSTREMFLEVSSHVPDEDGPEGYTQWTFADEGDDEFIISAGGAYVDIILVAGGGGGGGAFATGFPDSDPGPVDYGEGGGGGGGGVRLASVFLEAGTYSFTVGAGGAPGSKGANTTFNGLTAEGGGKGGGAVAGDPDPGLSREGGDGGCGGGTASRGLDGGVGSQGANGYSAHGALGAGGGGGKTGGGTYDVGNGGGAGYVDALTGLVFAKGGGTWHATSFSPVVGAPSTGNGGDGAGVVVDTETGPNGSATGKKGGSGRIIVRLRH
jgi:hypothetical protein